MLKAVIITLLSLYITVNCYTTRWLIWLSLCSVHKNKGYHPSKGLHWLLPAAVEHIVDHVPGKHVLVDVSLRNKQHITEPTCQPAPLPTTSEQKTRKNTFYPHHVENTYRNIRVFTLAEAINNWNSVMSENALALLISSYFQVTVCATTIYSQN